RLAIAARAISFSKSATCSWRRFTSQRLPIGGYHAGIAMMVRRLRLISGARKGTDDETERAGSMKVAFATEDLSHVDAHFGWAKNIAVYGISPEGYKFVEVIQFEGELKEDGNEDKLGPKIDAVRDCAILYVA